jgi:hypothetical protein
LSPHALPSETRNKQENKNDTSSHYNLFNAEFALALELMDFTPTGIKGMSPETSSTTSRVPNIDDERSDGGR